MSYDELEKYIKASLKKAISDAGNMRKLAQQRGMDYPTIYRFNSGDNAIGNMPLRTLVKLFPDLALFCFPSDYMNSKQPVSGFPTTSNWSAWLWSPQTSAIN